MDRGQAEQLAEGLAEGMSAATVSRGDFEAKMDAMYWRTIGAVAVMLLAHLAAVWAIVGALLKPS